MQHAIIENGNPVLYTERFFVDAGGVQYPLKAMNTASKRAIGVYEVQHDYTVSDGFRSVGRKLEFDPVADMVREVPDLLAIPVHEIQAQFATHVKAECKRRILAVADAETQQNIAQVGILYSTFRLNGLPEAEALSESGLRAGDMTTAAAFRGWVSAMSQAAGGLIVAGDTDYQDDTKWPAVPDGVVDLAGRF